MTGTERLDGQRETLVSLKDYLDSEIEHERELRNAQQAAHRDQHTQDNRALELAATMAKANKEDANEWRGAMTDRERTFYPRHEAESLVTRLAALERADTVRGSAERERERGQLRVMALIGLVATVASIVISVFIKV